MKRKTAAILAVLALVAVAAGGFFLHRLPPAVAVAEPERGPAVRAVYSTGVVEPVESAQIGPKITGRVSEILVEEGEQVAAGQVLARLDDRSAQARVAELEARLAYREAEARRAEELFARGHTSAQARDLAVSDVQQARSALAAAQEQLQDYVMRAPFAGMVLRSEANPGETVQAGETLFWVGCCDRLRIEAEVDEEDIPLVRVGQPALIRADAFPDRVIEGSVSQITPRGDPVTRTFRVRVALPQGTELRPGMNAEVNILVERRDDALLVPEQAVRDGAVWVVRDGRAHRRPVEVGIVGGGKAEIRQGLAGGEPVVLDPPAGLEEGMEVRARPEAT